jgi:hypothetical protein
MPILALPLFGLINVLFFKALMNGSIKRLCDVFKKGRVMQRRWHGTPSISKKIGPVILFRYKALLPDFILIKPQQDSNNKVATYNRSLTYRRYNATLSLTNTNSKSFILGR